MDLRDLRAIIKATESLAEGELKPYLRFILANIQAIKEQDGSRESAVAELIELYDELMGLQEKRAVWDPVPSCTYVHIVSGDSFAGGMKQALKELGWADKHKLIALRENYAMGPLEGLDSPEGRKARSNWFLDNIAEAFEAYAEFEEEYRELLGKLEQIPERAEVIVWASGNACEQIGMRHAIYLMRNKRHSISVYDACAICEELHNRPDAAIRYRHSGEISAKELQGALIRIDGRGRLTTAGVAQARQEWQTLSKQTGVLRIWQDNEVLTVPADYYDQYLLEKLDSLRPPALDNEFLKSARLIGEAMGHCEQPIGDSYLEYRLRELIYNGILEIKGVPAAMRFYSVRRKRRSETGPPSFR